MPGHRFPVDVHIKDVFSDSHSLDTRMKDVVWWEEVNICAVNSKNNYITYAWDVVRRCDARDILQEARETRSI